MASEQPRPRGAERTIRTRASVTSPCFWFIMIHVSNTDYFPLTNPTSGNDILMHNYFCKNVFFCFFSGHVTSWGARLVTSGCWCLMTLSGTLVITCSSGESADNTENIQTNVKKGNSRRTLLLHHTKHQPFMKLPGGFVVFCVVVWSEGGSIELWSRPLTDPNLNQVCTDSKLLRQLQNHNLTVEYLTYLKQWSEFCQKFCNEAVLKKTNNLQVRLETLVVYFSSTFPTNHIRAVNVLKSQWEQLCICRPAWLEYKTSRGIVVLGTWTHQNPQI